MAESPLIQSYLQVLRIAAYGNSLEDVYKLALSPFLNEDLLGDAQFVFQAASKCNIRYLTGDWQNKITRLFSRTSKEIVSKPLACRLKL